MRYSFSITPLFEENLENQARLIAAEVKRGTFNMPLFSMTLVPEGNPVWDKAEPLIRRYVRNRDLLAKEGVEAGILVQACLGHGYPIPRSPFQPYVNLTDGAETFVCCPMDQGFLAHFCDVMRRLAETRPKVIMLDDDVRLMTRPGRGCACPLHMAEFNRRAGTDMSREALLAHLKSTPKGDRLKRIFEEVQSDSIHEMLRLFRRAVDEVDPTIHGINCTSGHICEFVAENSKIFAGKGNPAVVRVPNGCYAPFSVREFSDGMRQAAICRSRLKKQGVETVLAETDTVPYNRYAKSARYLHAHYCASILEGAKGAKHWLSRSSAWEPNSSKAYRDILAKHVGLYDTLADIADAIRWVGVNSFFVEQTHFECFDEAAPRYYFHTNDWITKNIERMGLPFFFSDQPEAMNLLEETVVDDMSDAQIEGLFEQSVLMDGSAAMALYQRGFGDRLGVRVEEWNTGLVTVETFGESSEIGCSLQKNRKKLTATDPDTEILSYNSLKEPQGVSRVAPAVTALLRDNGKWSVVCCGSPNALFKYTEGFAFLNESRKTQLIDLFSRAGALPVYLPGDDEVCLRAGYLPDGRLLTAIYALGIDPIEELCLYLEKEPRAIRMLNERGEEVAIDFTSVGNGFYSMPLRIEALYPVFLLVD